MSFRPSESRGCYGRAVREREMIKVREDLAAVSGRQGRGGAGERSLDESCGAGGFLYVACGVDLGEAGSGPLAHVREPLRVLAGWRVPVVLCGLADGAGHAQPCKVLTEPLKKTGWVRHFVNTWRLLRAFVRALQMLSEEAPVYIRWGSQALPLLVACRAWRLSTVVEFNGLACLERNQGSFGTAAARMTAAAEALGARVGGCVVVTTDAMRQELLKRAGDGVTCIVNGCGASEEFFRVKPTWWRAERRLPTVAFVGGFWTLTGFDLVLKMLPTLLNKCPRIRLKIAGDGPLRSCLADFLGAAPRGVQLEYVGRIQNEDVPQFLADVDVGIAPYRDDPFLQVKGGGSPQKVYEYLAAARMVVLPDLPYYESLAVAGGCFSFAAGSAEALSVATGRALAMSTEEYWERQTLGREYARRSHSWERNAESLLGAIDFVRSGVSGGAGAGGSRRRAARPSAGPSGRTPADVVRELGGETTSAAVVTRGVEPAERGSE